MSLHRSRLDFCSFCIQQDIHAISLTVMLCLKDRCLLTSSHSIAAYHFVLPFNSPASIALALLACKLFSQDVHE